MERAHARPHVTHLLPFSAVQHRGRIEASSAPVDSPGTLSSHKLTEYQGRVLKPVSGSMTLALGAVLVIDPALLNDLRGAAVTLSAAVAGVAGATLIHWPAVRGRFPRPGQM